MLTETDKKLMTLYKKMSDLTAPECRSSCRVPLSCCSPEYCNMAQEYAKEEWNTDLEILKTDHPRLPFMGPKGCVVPPYLRPLCTVHTCAVSGAGLKLDDPEWNEKYFALREEIEELEWERSKDKHTH